MSVPFWAELKNPQFLTVTFLTSFWLTGALIRTESAEGWLVKQTFSRCSQLPRSRMPTRSTAVRIPSGAFSTKWTMISFLAAS